MGDVRPGAFARIKAPLNNQPKTAKFADSAMSIFEFIYFFKFPPQVQARQPMVLYLALNSSKMTCFLNNEEETSLKLTVLKPVKLNLVLQDFPIVYGF